MAPILSHGQTTSGQCGFNQAASHPADPIKRHRARRERSHPKAMLTTQTSAVALDLLENSIGQPETNDHVSGKSALYSPPEESAPCQRHSPAPGAVIRRRPPNS